MFRFLQRDRAPLRVVRSSGGTAAPDVTVEVVFDGDRCIIEGEPLVERDEWVSCVFRNESRGLAGASAWADGSGVAAADLGTDNFDFLLDRADVQSAWMASPGGATEVRAVASRAQPIVNCWSEAIPGDFPAGIIAVGP